MSIAAPPREKFRSDVLWNFASLAFLGISGIGLNVLISDVYGAAALGVFNQVWTVYIFFSQLAVGGIDLSALKEVSEHRESRGRVLDIALGALVPTLVLGGAATLLFVLTRGTFAGMFESPGVATGMAMAAPGLFCFALNKVLFAILNGLQRMRAFAILQSCRFVGLLVGFFVAQALGLAAEEIAFVLTFSEGVTFLGLAFEVGRHLAWRRGAAWTGWSGRHLAYGVRSFLSGALLELNSRVDILMLGIFHGDAVVGVYSFAAMLAEGVFQLLVKLQNNYNPILAQHIATKRLEELRPIVRRGKRVAWLLMLAVSVVAVLAYPLFLLILDDPEFAAGRISFAILLAGIVLSAGYMPFQQTLLMAGHPALHTFLMALVVGTNVVGNALLIPSYAGPGAAIATAIAFVASCFYLHWMVRSRVGLLL